MRNLRVATASTCAQLANCIATVLKEEQEMTLSAIGAGAVNQAVKGIAVARGMLCEEGYDIVCKPSFKNVFIDGIEKSAINISLEACAI